MSKKQRFLWSRAWLTLQTIGQTVSRLRSQGDGWLVPAFLVLLLFSAFLAALALVPGLAPFVYPLF